MSSPQAGATSDNVVHDNGSFDPELARAYTLMASQEFKRQWYLESTRNEDSNQGMQYSNVTPCHTAHSLRLLYRRLLV